MRCGCKISDMYRSTGVRYINGFRYVQYLCKHDTEDWRQDSDKAIGFRKQCYNKDKTE